jgi:hypothetical protein
MSASYITDSEGNVVYPKTLAKCVNKGGSTLEEYLNDVEDATLIKPTAQGTDIQLKDSSDMNIQELHLFGRTEQKTTKGINLLKTEQQDETRDGITITRNDDGTYVLNGTATIDVDFSLTSKFPAEKGKTYRMTGISKEKSGIFMYVTDGSTSYSCASGVGVTFTYTSESGKKYIHLLIPSGKTLNNITVKPMIVDGLTYPNTTYDDYEPYTGGQPSPSPDYPQEIKSIENPTVSVAGKNLFEPSTINYSYNNLRITANVDNSQKNSIKIKINTINATEGDLYALAYVDINKFVKKIKSNTTYTIVLKNPQNIGAVFVGTIIGTNRITNTVAVKSNVIKLQTIDDISNKSTFPLVFYFAGTVKENVTIGFDDIAIYEGDYPNAEIEEFKEVQSAQQTCELNGIDDVKDELIVNADGTGKFVQRINKSSLNDKSNFAKWYETTNTYGFEVYDSNCAFYSSKINIIAEKLQGKTIDILNSGVYNANGITISPNGKIKIKILKKYLAEYSTDALKKFLKNNTIKILTILPEPTVTDLTAEEVQKILALHTNKPNTTIWNDQNADMQITYVADTKKYIDNKFTELENSVCGGLLITDNLIDNSNMLNNTALTISDKISTSSNSTYKTYLNIPVKAGESYYIGKSHRNSCIIDSIENKKVLQSNMVNQTDSYIFNVNYDGFLCVCFYTTEQNPKIALLTREKTES